MPVTHTEPNNFPPGASGEEDLDARARKRVAVGLSPHRPTAKAAPQRPPDYPSLPVSPLALSLLLIAVLVGTTLLLGANLSGWSPTGWLARFDTPDPVGQPRQGALLAGSGYTLRLAEDFSSASSTLLQGEQRQEWRTELLPAESVYRFQVWPGHLAWSLLGLDDVTRYRLQTDVVVDAASPNGYAGLIARYQDDRHFYLLAVDGEGRYWVQLQDGDAATTLQPWTPAAFLNKAGTSNMLTLEDTGAALRFYANGMLLHEIPSPRYTPGHVGLAGGAQGSDVAQLRFDWLQFFDASN
jgi:hypothetical protein